MLEIASPWSPDHGSLCRRLRPGSGDPGEAESWNVIARVNAIRINAMWRLLTLSLDGRGQGEGGINKYFHTPHPAFGHPLPSRERGMTSPLHNSTFGQQPGLTTVLAPIAYLRKLSLSGWKGHPHPQIPQVVHPFQMLLFFQFPQELMTQTLNRATITLR